LTRLIREEQPPPPPVVAKEPVPVREEQAEPIEEAPILAERKAPEPSPGPEAKKKDVAPKGILAFREKFSSIAKNKAADRLGSNARITSTGGESGPPERSLVTSLAAGSSGGINLSSLSRDIGDGSGREMGGVAVVQATSSIGSGGGSERPLSGGPGLSRTDEEIQIVFDRHKAALYRLYNRELRRDPTLKGQIVLRMTIEADGSVSLCVLKSTDMKSKTLSDQVIERVKTFDFGAKEGIPAVTIVYPIDFLPAA
jgi:outer membrane biosynthesis protein TonB